MSYRRPYRLSLRLQLDSFGIRNPVTKLRGLATPDGRRAGVKTQNAEVPPPELLHRQAVLLVLLLRAFLCSLAFDIAVILPARNHYKHNAEQSHDKNSRRIQQRVFQWRLRFSNWVRHHGHAP